MPKPREGESRDDFVGRCIPETIRDGTTNSQDQATAICFSIWERRNMTHRTLTALADGASLRTASFHGRRHLVAPVVMLIGDSVVRPVGSRGPELVPSSVLAEAPTQWNGRPIVATHPFSGTTSANSPRVLEDMQFGTVFGATFSRGALRAEAWLDVQRAVELGGDALEALSRIEEGETLEVSVGAFVTMRDEPGTTRDGQSFQFRWTTIASDHLAVGLGGHAGACSNEMGCGIPRLNADYETAHDQALLRAAQDAELRTSVLSTARRPNFSGTESSRWSAPTFMDYVSALFDGDDPPSSVNDAPASLRARIASHTLLGDANATTLRELAFFPVVRPSTGRLNERALRAVLGGRGSQANISTTALRSARNMARSLLNQHFDADLEPEAFIMGFTRRTLFSKVLDAFGLDLTEDRELKSRLEDLVDQADQANDSQQTTLDSGAVDSRAVSPDTGHDDASGSGDFTDKEPRAREAIESEKNDLIGQLIASPDSPFVEADREALMGFSLDQLNRMVFGDSLAGHGTSTLEGSTHALQCSCEGSCTCQDGDSQGHTSGGVMADGSDDTSAIVADDDQPNDLEVTHMSDVTQVTNATDNTDTAKSVPVRKELITASKKDLIGLVIHSAISPFKADDWDQLASFSEDRLRALVMSYMPDPQPKTTEEWLATAPPEFASFYRRSLAAEAGQREELIRALNQHQDDYTVEELRAMDTDDLEKLARLSGLAKRRDYSGRGLPVITYADEHNPPDPYEAGLDKRRQSYN